MSHSADTASVEIRLLRERLAQAESELASLRQRTAETDECLANRRFFEQSTDGMAIVRADGTVRRANPAFARLLRRHEEDVAGISLLDHFDDEADPIADWLREADADESYREATVVALDGHRAPVRLSAWRNDPSGDLSLTIVDLSSRHANHLMEAIREQLEDSERAYRSMFEHNPHPMWIADRESQRLLAANDSALALYDANEDGFLSRRVTEIWPNATETFDEAVRTGARVELETSHLREDGKPFHVDVSATPVSFGGRPAMLVLALDISERVRAQEALRLSEERFRLSTEAMRGVVYDWNLETNTVYRSEEFQRITGYAPSVAEQTEDFWYERIHPDDRRHADLVYGKVRSGEIDRYDLEVRLRHRDGHYIDVWDRGKVVENRTGSGKRVVGLVTDITFIRHAERAAIASEQRYRALAENSGLLVLTLDATGAADYINPRWAEVTGQTIEQALGMGWRYAVSAEDTVSLLNIVAAQGAAPKEFEFRLRDVQTGEFRWHLAQLMPIEEAGHPRWILTAFDIDDRRRAQDRIAESEERFKVMADSAPALIWMSGLDKGCFYFNRGWLEFTGRTLEEEVGHGWAQGVHPDDFDRCVHIYSTYFDRHEPFVMRYRLRRADGEYRWLIDNGTPRFSPSGEFLGFIGACMDIHDMVGAEEALRVSRERYQALVHATSQIVWMTEADGRVTQPLRTWSTFTGQMTEDLLASGWIEYVHPDDRARVIERWNHFRERSEGFEDTFRLRHHSGDYRIVTSRAVPMQAADGSVREWVGTLTDITEEHLAKEALARAKAQIDDILDSLTEPFVAFDRDFCLTFVNPAYARRFDSSPAELVGKSLWELGPELKGGRYEEILRRAMEERKPVAFEYFAEHTDQWFANTIHPTSEGIAVFSMDATARKRAERELAEREQRYRALVEASTSVVIIADGQGKLSQPQPAWEAFTGLKFEDYRDNYIYAAIHPDDVAWVSESRERAIAAAETFNAQMRVWSVEHGAYRRCMFNGVPVKNPDGSVRERIITVTDIQDQWQADEALRESQARLAVAVEGSQLGAFQWDLVTGEITCNETLYDQFGGDRPNPVPYEEFVRRVHPQDIARVEAAIRESIETLTPYDVEYRVVRLDGGVRYIRAMGQPFADESGRAVRFDGFTIDLTPQHETAHELRDIATRLQLALDSAKMGTWIHIPGIGDEPRGSWDARCREIFGFPAGFAPTLTDIFSRIHPDDRERMRKAVDAALDPDGDGRYEAEYRIAIEGEPVRWVYATGKATMEHTVDGDLAPHLTGVIVDITERRRAEEALRQSQQRLAVAVEASRLGAWRWNLENGEIEWSDTIYDQFGIERGRPLELNEILALLHPNDVNGLTQAIERSMETLEPYEVEYRVLRPDGGVRYLRAMGQPFADGSGRPVQFDGFTVDLTQQYEAAEALRNTATQLQLAIDSAEMGTWEFRSFDEPVRWDTTCAALFGYQVTDTPLISELFFSIVDEDRQAVAEAVAAATDPTSDGRYDIEYRLAVAGQPIRWVRATGQAIFEGEGEARRVLRFGGVVMDVTERREAFEAIRESEAHVRRIIDNMLGFVGVLDLDGTLTEANGAALQAGGITREDVVGKKFWDCYWWSYDAELGARLQEAIRQAANGEIVRYDVPVRMAGDTRMWIDFMLAPVFDADGRVTHIIPSGIDIAARKQFEEALQASEERFRLATEAMSGLVYDFNLQTGEVKRSVGLYGLTGYRLDEVPDDNEWWKTMVHPDDVPQIMAEWQETQRTRAHVRSSEYRIRHKSGDWVWVWDQARIVYDREMNPVRMIGCTVSIDEQRRAAEALREREERLRQALDAGQLGAWTFDLETGEIDWDERTHLIFGVSQGRRITYEDVVFQAVHPEDRLAVHHAAQRAMDPEGEGIYSIQHRVIREDGRVVWVHCQGKTTFAPMDGGLRGIRMTGTARDITQEREAADAIREREARLAQALEAGRLGSWFLDLKSMTISMDDRMSAMYGLEKVDSVPTDAMMARLVSPMDRDEILRALEQVVDPSGDGLYDLAHQILRPDGQIIWVHATGQTFFDESDGQRRAVQVVGTVRDITEAKIAAEKIRLSEERFQTALLRAPVILFNHDRELRYTWIHNPALGYDSESVVGKTDYELLNLESAERLMTIKRKVLQTGIGMRSEVDVGTPGDHHIYDLTVEPIFGENDEVVGVACVAMDVTERIEAERARAKSEAERQFLAESIPQIVFTTRPNGVTDYTNRALHDYTGKTQEEMQQIGWVGVRHPDDQAAATAAWNEAVANGTPYECLYRLRRHDGEYRWHLARALPMKDEQGNIIKWFGTCTDLHDQRMAEEARRASEARLKAILDNSPNQIWAKDLEGRYILSNPAHVALMPVTHDELIGKTDDVAWGSEVGEIFRANDRKVLEQRGPRAFEESALIDGEMRTYLSVKFPLFDHQGEPYATCGIATDITDRIRSQEALERSQERLRIATEAANLGIFEWTSSDNRTNWDNHHMYAITGWDPTGPPPTTDEFNERILHPDDRDAFLQKIGRAMEGNGEYHDLFRIRRPDGTVRWVRAAGRFDFDDQGQARRMVGVLQDVTEERQAADAVRESEARFRLLADNIAQLAWMAEPDGMIYWYNRRWFDYTGTTLAEMVGDGWRSVHHPDHVDKVTTKYFEHMRRGVPWEDTFPLRGADGQYHWFLSRAIPSYDEAGNITRWFGTNTDVTEQLEAQKALRESEERYRAFVANSSEGVYRLEFDPPIPTHLPVDEQIDLAFANGRFAECNDAFARMYGYEGSEEVIGARLKQMLPAEQAASRLYLASVIQGGYRADGVESVERDNEGRPVYFSNSVAGVIEDGALVRAWGIQRDITQAKRAEAQLRESEERLRLASRATNDAIWDWTIGNDRIQWNEAINVLFGRELPDLVTDPQWWRGRIHPEDREEVWQAIDQVIGGESDHWSATYRFQRDSGDYATVFDRGYVLRDRHGKASRMIGAMMDMTQQIKAEAALREREEQLRAFFESDVTGILFGDIYGGIQQANDEFLRIVGYSREDLDEGRFGWADLTPEEWLPLDELHIAEARERGACVPYEKQYICKDGTRVWVLVGYALVGERREQSVAFILDLTARKAAEQAMTESEEKFRTLAESVPAFVWMCTPDGANVYCNQRMAEYAGVKPEDLSSWRWMEIIHPEDTEVSFQRWQEALENGTNFDAEIRYRNASGQYRWFLVRAIPLLDENGEIEHWLGFSTDVEDRKQAEADLLALNQGLEKIVAERTRSLIDFQEQLRRTERLASLGTLAAGIAHEINNPLNSILMTAEYAASYSTMDPKEAFSIIVDEAQRGGQIVKGILKFAKEEQTAKNPGDFNDVVAHAAELGKLYAQAPDLVVDIDLDPTRPIVEMNPTEIEQVIVNLVKNAAEAADGRVCVRLQTTTDDHWVTLHVEDNGPGMSEETLRHVFDPFFSTKRQSGGTGLGLSVSHGIVTDHGGTISARSTVGKGTEFIIRLPLRGKEQE